MGFNPRTRAGCDFRSLTHCCTLSPGFNARTRAGCDQHRSGVRADSRTTRLSTALSVPRYTRSNPRPTIVRGRVKVRLGWVYSWLRNYPRAVARLNEAIKVFREAENHEGLAEAHFALGRTYMEINESSMARDHLEQAIELQRYSTNRHFLAQVYLRCGTVEFNEGDIYRATDFWERARELADDTKDDNLRGMISINLGVAHIHADRGERGKRSLTRGTCGHRSPSPWFNAIRTACTTGK